MQKHSITKSAAALATFAAMIATLLIASTSAQADPESPAPNCGGSATADGLRVSGIASWQVKYSLNCGSGKNIVIEIQHATFAHPLDWTDEPGFVPLTKTDPTPNQPWSSGWVETYQGACSFSSGYYRLKVWWSFNNSSDVYSAGQVCG
jgi:hypothetical protein